MIEKEIINFERTVIVGIVTQNQDEEKLKEYLDELEFLTFTAGGEVIKRFSQKMDKPNPKTFVGTGKLEEIAIYIKENDISTIIFDDELTPSQSKNITKIFDIKVLDRTNLILDIFAQRAQTSYARTQVELAQCIYLLPRLSGMWTHLERQRGGIGMRGPGETEIETDRRIVRDRIALLKDKIKEFLGDLSPREQKILRMRFGLEDGKTHTLEEVGQEFGVTRERIRQIEAKALTKLKKGEQSKDLEDYLSD